MMLLSLMILIILSLLPFISTTIRNNNTTITTTNNNTIHAKDLVSFQDFLLLGSEEAKKASSLKYTQRLKDIDRYHDYTNIFDSDVYELSHYQRLFYKLYGFLIIKNVFDTDTVLSYLSTMWTAIRTETSSQAVRGPFITDTNVWMKSKKLSEFILNKKLARLATELMDVKGVRLYQDKPFYKGPDEVNSPPHQDRFGTLVRSEHHKMIAAWMPLSFNTSSKTGALIYLPASHRKRKLFGKGFSFNPCPLTLQDPDAIWGDEVKIRNMTLLAEAAGMVDARQWVQFKGFQGSCGATFISPFVTGIQPGDIAFHDGYLVHASTRNSHQRLVRAAVSVQYFEDGAFRDSEMNLPINNYTNDGASQILWGNETEKGNKITSKYTPLLYHTFKPQLVGVANYLKMKGLAQELQEFEVPVV